MTPASTSTSQADQFSILFRATNGSSDPSKKIKFSTLVSPSDLSSFQASYLPALRTSLSTSLRKRDKAKERKVDKLLAQQKKKIEEDGGKVKIGGKSEYMLERNGNEVERIDIETLYSTSRVLNGRKL